MKRVFQRLKEQSFWKRFLWQFPLMFVFFSIGNLILGDAEDGFHFNGLLSTTGTAFFMAFIFSFQSHKYSDAEESSQETIEELQKRNWKYYLGLYAFTLLLFCCALTVMLLIGLIIFLLIIKTDEDIWNTTWKAYVVAAIMSAILVLISFVTDQLERNRLKAS